MGYKTRFASGASEKKNFVPPLLQMWGYKQANISRGPVEYIEICHCKYSTTLCYYTSRNATIHNSRIHTLGNSFVSDAVFVSVLTQCTDHVVLHFALLQSLIDIRLHCCDSWLSSVRNKGGQEGSDPPKV